ncbi:MAG: LysM peptidoglycan-binding domain-containing protein [Hymenobacter sp.]
MVQKGDTLYNISRRFRVSVEQLRRLNKLKSDDVKLGRSWWCRWGRVWGLSRT